LFLPVIPSSYDADLIFDTMDSIRPDATATEKSQMSKNHASEPSRPESMASASSPDLEHGTMEGVDPGKGGLLDYILRLEIALGFEARGIDRVPEALRERQTVFADYAQMSVIWFSSNITANNMLLGILGPLLFEVGLVDGMILGAFGAMLGAMCAGYTSTFGPLSGCRTMVSNNGAIGATWR
jgi:hypothetical protein